MIPSDDRGRDAAPDTAPPDPPNGDPGPSAETTSAVVRVSRAREEAAATAAPAFVPAQVAAPASRDLANVTFPTVWRGYDTAAVDAYVRQVSRVLTELEETRTPQDVVRRALDRVGQETSQILHEAEEAAQRITTKSRADAAERVQKAETEAHEITQRARTRLRELDADVDRIWLERQRIIDDTRKLANRLLEMADDAEERFPAEETESAEAVAAGEAEPPAGSEEGGVSSPGADRPQTPAAGDGDDHEQATIAMAPVGAARAGGAASAGEGNEQEPEPTEQQR